MNLKHLHQALKTVRDNAAKHGELTGADKETLHRILDDMRPAGNDNAPFTEEQLRKISIVEKTGTGSKYVH